MRGLGWFSWLLFPLIMICDIHLLIDAFFANKQNDPDKINFFGRLAIAQEFVPTPISKLAWKVTDKEQLLGELRQYWCGWRDNCEFMPLYEKKVKEINER